MRGSYGGEFGDPGEWMMLVFVIFILGGGCVYCTKKENAEYRVKSDTCVPRCAPYRWNGHYHDGQCYCDVTEVLK